MKPIPPDLVGAIRALLRAVEGGADDGTIRTLCWGEQDPTGRFAGGLLDLIAPLPARDGRFIQTLPVSDGAKKALGALRAFLLPKGWRGFSDSPDVGVPLLLACLAELEQPWEGEDWEELAPLPKRLLVAMRGRERADLAALFEPVWGLDFASPGAVSGALNAANTFLAKRSSPRCLHKVRGEPAIEWR
jgi:hypothetical protein